MATRKDDGTLGQESCCPRNLRPASRSRSREGDNAREVAIDTALLDRARPMLKEAGLTNEQAQKLAALRSEGRGARRPAADRRLQPRRPHWAERRKDDPEIGGKNWDATDQLWPRRSITFVGSG
jgi:hypothetical protein